MKSIFVVVLSAVCTINISYGYVGFDNLGTYRGTYSDGRPYEKTYYMPSFMKTTWVNVRPFCQSFGMEILSLETYDEAVNFMKLCEYNYYIMDTNTYIGGYTTQLKNPNTWYWVNSGRKIDYNLAFGLGMPDNLSALGEYCLAIGKGAVPNSFFFNDIYCYSPFNAFYDSYKFICQTN